MKFYLNWVVVLQWFGVFLVLHHSLEAGDTAQDAAPQLAASALTVGPLAGAESVLLDMALPTEPWSASSDASWLRPVATSGTGSGLVAYSYDANTGATRSGTLTIAGQTFVVTQAGSNYVAAGPLTVLASTGLKYPFTVAVDHTGNVYIADANNNALKKWDPVSNAVSTVVATGLETNNGVAVDAAGNVYIADTGNNAIKKWEASSGNVTTLVSTGLHNPYGVAVDKHGNVYIADTSNDAIKKWTASTQVVSTIVSTGIDFPTAVAVDFLGNLYIADTGNHAIKKWTAATNVVSTSIGSGLSNPSGVAVDASGNVYIADNFNDAIKKWSAATQTVTTLAASGLNRPQGLAVDAAGNVFVGDSQNNAIAAIPRAYIDTAAKTVGSGAGASSISVILPSTTNLRAPFAPTSSQTWLAIGAINDGVVNFSFTANNTGGGRTGYINLLGQSIAVHQGGTAPTITASTATLSADANSFVIYGMGFNAEAIGNVVTLSNGAVGIVTAATSTSLTVMLISPPTSDGPFTATVIVSGVSSGGSVQVGTVQAVRRLAAASVLVGPVSGSGTNTFSVFGSSAAWQAASNVSWLQTTAVGNGSANVRFFFDANPGATRTGKITIGAQEFTVVQAGASYSAANGLTALASAELSNPTGVAVDQQGNVYVADYGSNSIKKWSKATNVISTLSTSAAPLNGPTGVAVDGEGNVYIADSNNHAIKKWSANTQTVSTLNTSAAPLSTPYGVAVDRNGNVYIADSGNSSVKKWSPIAGNVSTLVSNGLKEPQAVAVDDAGNVYIADTLNNALKVRSATTGAVSVLVSGVDLPRGVAVDFAGNVYASALATNSIVRWTAATSTAGALVSQGLSAPFGVAVDGAGNLYIGDQGNGAIKERPHAFVDATPITKTATAGSDALPVVLPVNRNLGAPFVPTSDQAWLTIGGVANGVVSYSYSANDGAQRVANIHLLGRSIAVNQRGMIAVTPNTANLAPNATTLVINGEGFDAATPGNNIVVFNHQAQGVVTASTATSLTVTFTAPPVNVGSLTVVVSANGFSSGAPVQVATMTGALSTYTLLEGKEGGNASVLLNVVTPTTAWTAVSNAPWLTVTAGYGSGTNSAKVMFTVAANSGATRTGTLTVAGRALTVTQAGTGYVAANPLTTLASAGIDNPTGVAVDRIGNVYVADYGGNAIRKWNRATNTVTTLDTSASPLNGPEGIAVDGYGNVYIADTGNHAIKKWTAATGAISVLNTSASPLSAPVAVGLDLMGNVFISDSGNRALKKWNAATDMISVVSVQPNIVIRGLAVDLAGNVYFSDSSNRVRLWLAFSGFIRDLVAANAGLNTPRGVALDGEGSVYISDTYNNAVKKFDAATDTLSTLISGVSSPYGVAVDGNGSVFVADQGNRAVKQRPYAFVDTTARSVSANSGSDALPPVLSAGQSLLAPFVPTTNQPWLSVGAISNGVVHVHRTANLSASSRVGQVSLLGQAIDVTQAASQGTGIGAWRFAWFGTTSNTGNAANAVDANSNGIENLLEYAFDGDPIGQSSGLGILPVVSVSAGNRLQIAFNRYLDRSDITLVVQASDTLPGGWTDLAQSVNGAAFTVSATGATIGETGTGNARLVTVQDLYQLSDAAHPRRFMRVLVKAP